MECVRASVLYLHGFASSPRGQKAQAIGEALRKSGLEFEAPDLNIPSFEKLDFDAMVDHAVAQASISCSAVIVGSSLGALVALEASRHLPPTPLVLIAPAIGIRERWLQRIPPGDPISVFNYATGAHALIHRAFFERMTALRTDQDPPPSSVSIFMGRKDESVPFDRVYRIWDSWEKSGWLVAGSRFLEIPDGDHGLVLHAGEMASEIARLIECRKEPSQPLAGESP